MRVLEVSTGPAESRVDRIAGEWSAIRAELRTKGVLLGAMTVATRLPRTFESSDLEFVAAWGPDRCRPRRARQHTKEARTDYLTGLAIDRSSSGRSTAPSHPRTGTSVAWR